MSKKLVLIFIMCSLWVDAARPGGTQLSKCRFVQGKLCEAEQEDTGQHTYEQNDKLQSQNANIGGTLKLGSPTVTSSSQIEQHSSIFVNYLQRQWKHQQLQKARTDSSGIYERLENDHYRHTLHKPEPVVQLQQHPDVNARKDRKWRQKPSRLTVVEETQKYNSINKEKQAEGFRTPSDNQEKSETYHMNTRSSHLIHHRSNNQHPNTMTYSHGKNAEILFLSSQEEKSYGKLITESTTIHPFIATRQALDYLTSYDSRPRPRRWPLRLILPDREHSTDREVITGVGSITASHMQRSRLKRRNRHPRSAVDISRRVDENGARGNVRRGVHGKAEGTFTYENLTMNGFENGVAESATSSNTQRQGIFMVTKENTLDPHRSRNTAGSIPTDDTTARRGDEKRTNRRRQRQQKANKKSRKRKGHNNEMITETKFKTAVATNNIPSISSVDSVHVLLTDVAFQTQENDQIVKTTSDHAEETTELSISQPLKTESVSILKPLTGASDNSQIPNGCLLNQSSKRCVASESLGHDTHQANGHNDAKKTSQPTRKQRQVGGNRNKSKNKKGKRKSKDLNMSVQTANITDNHMFVSLWPDFNPTFFIPVNGKAVPTQTGVKALSENYTREITEVSSDNMRRIVLDKNHPAHVPAHTNSGPLNKPVKTSSDTWPLSQTVWTANYSSTEDVSRSTVEYSEEISQTSPTFVKSKTATINEIITATTAENIVNAFRNVSFTTSSFTISTATPRGNTSERSSGGFWKTRLRQSQGKISHENNHRMEKNSKNLKYNNTKDERRASLGKAFHKSTMNVTKQLPNSRGKEEIPENGPFIGYKTAYDFLSHQKGPKTNAYNEGRREANELNRFMGEGMCEIFNKHYVPTRIGGKCE